MDINNYEEIKPTYTRVIMYNENPNKQIMESLIKRIDSSIIMNDFSIPTQFFGELYLKGYAQPMPNDDGILTICEKLNSLLCRMGATVRINAQIFMQNDNDYIKKRREHFEPTKTYDLNNIDQYLYSIGYELMEILIYVNNGQSISEPFVIVTKRIDN